MKQQIILVAGYLILFARFAWADMTLVDPSVTGAPPWGDISGAITDGTIEAGNYRSLTAYREFGRIDVFPLSAEISYDLDEDGTLDSYAGSEIGLFYAQAYANVIVSEQVYHEFGSAQAEGSVCFTIDSSQLSLHWLYELSDYDFGFVNIYSLRVTDWETGDYLCYYSNVVGSPFEATETLDLIPSRKYVLYWSLHFGAGQGFDSDGWARLTIDPTEVVPVPSAFLLGTLGLSVAGWKLRKQKKQ